MNKNIKLAIAAVALLVVASCDDGSVTGYKYNYDVAAQYQKVWLSDVIYNETCCLIERDNGEIYGELLHEVKDLISVRDYTLKTEIDPSNYRVEGNKIYWVENSTLPYFTKENLEGKNIPDQYAIGTYDGPNGSKIMFTEGAGIVMHHIAVTYHHTESWDGTFPSAQKEKLSKTIQKLENKEQLNVVFYGDSIMTGCNASDRLGVEPYQLDFPSAFVSELKRQYEYEDIALFNPSLGGTISDWGARNVDSYVANASCDPDLVVIGFGMNDGSLNVPVDTYISNIQTIIDHVKAYNNDCEIITVATILPNLNSIQYRLQPQYLEPLKTLTERYEDVCLLDMTTFSGDLYRHKHALDLLANNINHPSDFLVRQYTSNLLNLFGL